MKPLAGVDVAILCGGLGTRLASVWSGPKCLAPVNGRPVLEHILDYLRSQGAERFVLLAGHRADDVKAWAEGRDNVTVSVEPKKLGSAGAVLHARGHFTSEQILVCNGDTGFMTDLSDIIASPHTVKWLWMRRWCDKNKYDAGVRVLHRQALDKLRAEFCLYPDPLKYTLEDFVRDWGVRFFGEGLFHDLGAPVTYKRAGQFFEKMAA